MVLILVYDSSRFKPVKGLKIYLRRVAWFSFLPPPHVFLLFSRWNFCVIISCKEPQTVAKMV